MSHGDPIAITYQILDLDSPLGSAVSVQAFDAGGTTTTVQNLTNGAGAIINWTAGPTAGLFVNFWRFTFQSGCQVDALAQITIH